MTIALNQPFVTVAKAVDPRDPILMVTLVHDAADDVIEAWTKATAGDDADGGLRRIKEDLFARASTFEAGHRDVSPVFEEVAVEEDLIAIGLPGCLGRTDAMQWR